MPRSVSQPGIRFAFRTTRIYAGRSGVCRSPSPCGGGRHICSSPPNGKTIAHNTPLMRIPRVNLAPLSEIVPACRHCAWLS